MYEDTLRKDDWEVRTVELKTVQEITKKYHYAKSGSNTATYRHGLFRKNHTEGQEVDTCYGIAWWIPPTKSSAQKTYPKDWRKVLSLSRLVVKPNTPKNSCSFLLSRSIKLIQKNNKKNWECLVTYADTWQSHIGTIYKATNWNYVGLTKPTEVYILNGKLVSRKAGPKTRTKKQMEDLGANLIGYFPKHKYIKYI